MPKLLSLSQCVCKCKCVCMGFIKCPHRQEEIKFNSGYCILSTTDIYDKVFIVHCVGEENPDLSYPHFRTSTAVFIYITHTDAAFSEYIFILSLSFTDSHYTQSLVHSENWRAEKSPLWQTSQELSAVAVLWWWWIKRPQWWRACFDKDPVICVTLLRWSWTLCDTHKTTTWQIS